METQEVVPELTTEAGEVRITAEITTVMVEEVAISETTTIGITTTTEQVDLTIKAGSLSSAQITSVMEMESEAAIILKTVEVIRAVTSLFSVREKIKTSTVRPPRQPKFSSAA
jgi:hypothetical protein